jgi:hypothetical protein
VYRILADAVLGLPKYYEWRSRSGCYFCFFQRRSEWVGLKEKHPELFEKAKQYEKIDPTTGERYTWNQRESLQELEAPARVAEIKRKHQEALKTNSAGPPGQRLYQIMAAAFEDEDDERPCLICEL